MIALLLAAQVATQVFVAPPPGAAFPDTFAAQARLQQARCRTGGMMQAGGAVSLLRPQDRDKVRISKLADLPKANKEIAVLRSVDGCPAPVVVQFNVGP